MIKIVIRLVLTGVSVFVFLTPSLVVEAQRTVTRTQTDTVFSTEIVTRNFACAKLVNVTGPCRRGRGGLLIDVPVILTFDEELEDSLDDTFNRIVHQQFVPSRTLGVEVTPLAIVPARRLQHAANFKYFSRNQLNSPSPTNHVLQSSQESSARNPGRNKVGAEGSDPEPRIYFSQINSVLNQIVNNFRPAVTVRVTNFVTRTTRVTAGSVTGSFFIMGCTPNPFTFATCATAPRSIST